MNARPRLRVVTPTQPIERLSGLPIIDAVAQPKADWEQLYAEINERHAQRLREVRSRERWAWALVALCIVLPLAVSLALRFWLRLA
jgi:hypothetical protein